MAHPGIPSLVGVVTEGRGCRGGGILPVIAAAPTGVNECSCSLMGIRGSPTARLRWIRRRRLPGSAPADVSA